MEEDWRLPISPTVHLSKHQVPPDFEHILTSAYPLQAQYGTSSPRLSSLSQHGRQKARWYPLLSLVLGFSVPILQRLNLTSGSSGSVHTPCFRLKAL